MTTLVILLVVLLTDPDCWISIGSIPGYGLRMGCLVVLVSLPPLVRPGGILHHVGIISKPLHPVHLQFLSLFALQLPFPPVSLLQQTPGFELLEGGTDIRTRKGVGPWWGGD